MGKGTPRGRRPAGGPDTREQILAAARDLFADLGFDRTTIRGVAAKAKVDPSLVHHYFKDKDGLLREVITIPVDPALVFQGLAQGSGSIGEELVRRLLTAYETVPGALERMVALIRTGLSHEMAGQAMRETFGGTVLIALREIVDDGDEVQLRAGLVGSQVVGLLMARYVVRIPGLADASIDEVAVAMGPNIEHYLRGQLGRQDGKAEAPPSGA